MTFCDKIRDLTDNKLILNFCDFVLEDVKAGSFPDYNKINLMTVPKLVPNIYVIDFRKGVENGLLMKFSGTKIDKHFGQNIQGKYLEETYTGDDKKEILFELYRICFFDKKPIFANRVVHYDEGKTNARYRLSTLLFLPCSSDGEEINFGVGMVSYTYSDHSRSPIFTPLDF
jgi:hypothetical protein